MKKLIPESLNEFLRAKDYARVRLTESDVIGGNLDQIKETPRLERSIDDLNLDFQRAVKYLLDNFSSKWQIIREAEITDPWSQIYLIPKDDSGNPIDKSPVWVIRDLHKNGQFISYEYQKTDKTARASSKAIFSNIPRSDHYNPYITWMDLVEKWVEIINDPTVKLPQHKIIYWPWEKKPIA